MFNSTSRMKGEYLMDMENHDEMAMKPSRNGRAPVRMRAAAVMWMAVRWKAAHARAPSHPSSRTQRFASSAVVSCAKGTEIL
eukprot:487675-Pleurochrysis_carterae.AAC.6